MMDVLLGWIPVQYYIMHALVPPDTTPTVSTTAMVPQASSVTAAATVPQALLANAAATVLEASLAYNTVPVPLALMVSTTATVPQAPSVTATATVPQALLVNAGATSMWLLTMPKAPPMDVDAPHASACDTTEAEDQITAEIYE